MYSRDELFLRSLEYHFNPLLTLSWALIQFVTWLHTLFYIITKSSYYHHTSILMFLTLHIAEHGLIDHWSINDRFTINQLSKIFRSCIDCSFRIMDNSYPRQLIPRTIRTQDNSYPGQLVPKTTRTQDNSYPRQLVPKTNADGLATQWIRASTSIVHT